MSSELLTSFIDQALQGKKNVAVVGRMGSGKSFFINKLRGSQMVVSEDTINTLASIALLKGAICEHHASDLKTFQNQVKQSLLAKGFSEEVSKAASVSSISLFVKMNDVVLGGDKFVEYVDEVDDNGSATRIYEDNKIVATPSWMREGNLV